MSTKKLILICLLIITPVYSFAADKIQVVTSFSILADICRNIGQDKIDVHTIIGFNSDAHAFEPAPTNVKQLAQADLLIYNGLDFEPWLGRLKQAAGFNAHELIASQGIELIKNQHQHGHDHGKADPHAWQSLENGIIYAQNISTSLSQIDPENASFYRTNADKYIDQLRSLDNKIRSELAAIPNNDKVVLTTHDSFAYFAKSYGVQFIAITGVSSSEEPSARRIATIIQTIKEQHVAAIFLEKTINNSVLQQIARETGSSIGGDLYSDTLDANNHNADTYLAMFNWNSAQIIKAIKHQAE